MVEEYVDEEDIDPTEELEHEPLEIMKELKEEAHEIEWMLVNEVEPESLPENKFEIVVQPTELCLIATEDLGKLNHEASPFEMMATIKVHDPI